MQLAMLITTIVGVISIIAIVVSPIAALIIQRKLDSLTEKKSRKLDIFKTLLATRANTVSFEHVRALNMIDIEFYDNKDIRDAWNLYRDHLNSTYPEKEEALQRIWEDKQRDYLTDLLYTMSNFLRYDFNKVILKKGAYNPIAHGLFDMESKVIRTGTVKLLTGQTPIKVELTNNNKATFRKRK